MVAIATAALAACQAVGPGPSPRIMKTAPGYDDATVYVGVVDRKNVKIFWYLDAGTGYTFTGDGIAIEDGRNDFDNCKAGKPGDVLDGGLTYRCHDNNHTKDSTDFPRVYKYHIRATGPGGPLELDPMVVND
jgi:hypothetical protein